MCNLKESRGFCPKGSRLPKKMDMMTKQPPTRPKKVCFFFLIKKKTDSAQQLEAIQVSKLCVMLGFWFLLDNFLISSTTQLLRNSYIKLCVSRISGRRMMDGWNCADRFLTSIAQAFTQKSIYPWLTMYTAKCSLIMTTTTSLMR